MRKLYLAILVFTTLALNGCAAQIQKEYSEAQSIMQTWVGATSGELVAFFGAPDNSFQLETNKVAYVYKREWTTGNNGQYQFSCTSTYIVNASGKIIDASFRWRSIFGENVCGLPHARPTTS